MEDVICSDVSSEEPTGERWDPLGAANDNDDDPIKFSDECTDYYNVPAERLRNLEEEQELLSSSLLALTTHFAQVQFRLRQIVDSPAEDKEDLLKSLEEFAFRGIPDVSLTKERIDETTLAEAMRMRRAQQQELIEKLKAHLRELELYAFESGEASVPQDIILERQRFILNELKIRMNLELDEQKYCQLTPAEVKQQVDVALGQLVSPLRMKEHLVSQLKTQVADLERFINYLQADTKTKQAKCACGCSLHSVKKQSKEETINIVQKAALLLQMFAMLHIGCKTPHFKKNDLKNTMKGNHWGDLRARLEMAIARVKDTILSTNNSKIQGDYSSDTESPSVSCNVKVTTAVRKYLATSIRDLMQHGATALAPNTSLVPFMGCFPRKHLPSNARIHAWEIILQYYDLKNGDRFNSTPARKLSQSFNLEIMDGSMSSGKHNMLCAIGSIISTHTPYKRSYDSHLKAFICAALNANSLVAWLNLIFQCRQLINMHYLPWSYVAKTGFKDSLQSLEVLTPYKFDLPVDLAIHQFQNIKDIFT